MNEKKSIFDLENQLVEKTGMSKRVAENFLREFIQVLEDNLIDEGAQVKIKGLGTFKNVKVEEKVSVNVNTGEEITIPAHNKVVFSPENTVKDLVNAPYAHLETVIIGGEMTQEEEEEKNSSSSLLEEQAKEIVSVLEEIKNLDNQSNESENDTKALVEDSVQDSFVSSEREQNFTVDSIENKEEIVNENKNIMENENQETVENVQIDVQVETKPKKKGHGWLIFFVILILLCVGVCLVYKFYGEQKWYEMEKQKMLEQREQLYGLSK